MGEEVTIALNRKARHEFSIDDTFEAGIVLTGSEIKSIRAHKVNLADAYARVERGEAWLIGAHIAPFEQANRNNHEPKRQRKLLLHRRQIDELLGRAKAKGQTIVPLRLYLNSKGPGEGRARPRPRQAAPRPPPRHRGARRPARRRAPAGRRPARPLNRRRPAGRAGQGLGGIVRLVVAFSMYVEQTFGPGDVWIRQGLDVEEREPRCRQASLNRRQNEVPGNRQSTLALAA